MTSRARAEHRRATRAHAKTSRARWWHSEEFGVQLGWCASSAELIEIRQRTHDSLIAQMGASRRGGVRWVQFTGKQALDELKRFAEDAPDDEHAEYYRQIMVKLWSQGGFLVFALAPGLRP